MSRSKSPLPALPLADDTRVTDVLVIGSGVAGLSAALGLTSRRVTLLTKAQLKHGGSSSWAQGGVAAAISSEDSPADHAADTFAAGAGLCGQRAVQILTTEGPRRVRQLIELGADFDRGPQGKLLLGREGAHGRRRILHAHGDSTGAEMLRALVAAVEQRDTITVVERSFAFELVMRGDRVVGALALEADGRTILYHASAVVLATGGLGQLYARTTNPAAVTGDGMAMAARAGARLADLELVQFHPTALSLSEHQAGGSTSLPLVTEALRGEGAILINDQDERFMVEEHPLAELAPRDIVARAIWRQQQNGRQVFLDARDAVGERFGERFPTVFALCRQYGIDPRAEAIPVTPAAHYSMGGVATDVDGRTSLRGLWACGEVTSTGVHGANRLASNSLLEGLVYGARVAEDIARHPRNPIVPDGDAVIWPDHDAPPLDTSLRERIRALMWREVGLVRDRQSLKRALESLRKWTLEARQAKTDEVPLWSVQDLFGGLETANLLTLARLVSAAALARRESRGAHFRADFPRSGETWKERLFWTYAPEEDFPLRHAPEMAGALEEIA